MADTTTLPTDAPEAPAAVREGLVTAAEVERALGQTVRAALDLGLWDEGGGVETLLTRLPRAVSAAVREEGRLRTAVRNRVLRALPDFPDAPPGAGVYRAADRFLQSARRHVLLNGAITAAQGACAGHDTLSATLVSVGVCLARYDGAVCSWRTTFLRHDYDCRHGATVEGLRGLLDRRAERGGAGAGFAAGRDRITGLLRRGFMAAAERKALRERAASPWRMGHGVPAPLELLTGSGCMELIDESLPLLEDLLLSDTHWVFLPDALGSRALTTLADALDPGEFAIVQKGKPALEAMVECGTYAAGYKRRVQAFAARLGEASVLGGFRATRFAPARLFVAHAERAAEAAVIALADAALQPHRGHPLLLDLAALGARSGLGVEAFRGVVESAYARAGATGLLADVPALTPLTPETTMPAENGAPELIVRELPENLDGELAAYARSAGREWRPDDADGRTQFDTPQSDDGTVVVVFPQDRFERWRSQALAHVESAEDGRTYLAQVVRGPYAAPIGLPAASPTLVVAQVEGTLFTPPYHGWAALGLLGEVRDGQTVVPLHRPRPNSRVRLLSLEETRAALGCDGDLRLGRAVGYPDIEVGLRSTDKHHVPRHTLVVGTTGAGKSTCLAGLIGRLAAAGFCVLVIDVEGEYTAIDHPADSPKIVPALEARGLAPEGVPETYLLVPTVAEASNPAHPRVRRFCLDFANISPHIAAELLQGNEAQADRFLAAYDAAGELVTQLVPAAERERHREALRAWDDQESGHPGLRLAQVLDMAEAVAALAGGEEGVAERYLHADGFQSHARELLERAAGVKKRLGHAGSWRKTVSLLGGLYRSGLFDRAGTAAPDGRAISGLDYQKMVAPGRVLVFDMAGVEAPAHRNLAISDLLRGVMEAQDRLYAAAPAEAKPRTAVVIEEAHEFVSAERIKQMPTLYGQIQRIARRGRKRWLGLVFATQFPQHLPGELFSLCNNRVLLRLGDEPTLARLRQAVGGVSEGLWARLKHLPTGQAIVSAQGIDPALIVALEPGRCKLRLVD